MLRNIRKGNISGQRDCTAIFFFYYQTYLKLQLNKSKLLVVQNLKNSTIGDLDVSVGTNSGPSENGGYSLK